MAPKASHLSNAYQTTLDATLVQFADQAGDLVLGDAEARERFHEVAGVVGRHVHRTSGAGHDQVLCSRSEVMGEAASAVDQHHRLSW